MTSFRMSPTLGPNMQVSLSPNYSYIFAFEQNFDKQSRRQWMMDNWHTVFYYVAAYMLVVFGGQIIMSMRPRYELRRVLAIWNILLAVFSIAGAFRTIPELLYVFKQFGFGYSVCNPSYIEDNKVSGFWTWMFTLSKVPELGDTIFIVLRKQNLIFLHWYHHITVLLYCWYTYKEHIGMGRWFVCMNYSVHSIMYTYYALRALRIKVPRRIAMLITMSQIIQMLVGCYVSVYGYQARARGEPCGITKDIAKLSLLMYFSYFVLFGKLFYNSYMVSAEAKSLALSNGQCNGQKKLQ